MEKNELIPFKAIHVIWAAQLTERKVRLKINSPQANSAGKVRFYPPPPKADAISPYAAV